MSERVFVERDGGEERKDEPGSMFHACLAPALAFAAPSPFPPFAPTHRRGRAMDLVSARDRLALPLSSALSLADLARMRRAGGG